MQLRELREYCGRRGWQISGEYIDTGWSGAKAQRPQLLKLMKDAGEHRFDCVLVWKLDRFSRSMMHLVEQLGTLSAAGVRFISTTQSIDTDQANPTSRLLLHILAAVAEFERELIKERVNAGLKSYRHAYESGRIGKDRCSRSGRNLAIGRPRVVVDRKLIGELARGGMSIRSIAAKLKTSRATVHRLLSQKAD